MNDYGYIELENVTRLRVHDEGYHWAIDGANGRTPQGYTENIWTHWDGEPMDRETALAHVDDFAREVGLPDGLPVFVETDTSWVQVR